MASYHPKDIEHGYCGNCHEYTGLPSGYVRAYFRREEGEEADLGRVVRILRAWFEERNAGDKIAAWLPEHLGR